MRHGIVILTDLPWREARPRWEAAEALGVEQPATATVPSESVPAQSPPLQIE